MINVCCAREFTRIQYLIMWTSLIFIHFVRFSIMADWFVYQRDVYPNDMDPDTLGMMIVPDYDAQGQVVYRDPEGTNMNGLRRVCTKWGIDPHFIQYDLVVHSVMNNGQVLSTSNPPNVQTMKWCPKKEQFRFLNLSNGFRFENHSQRMCMNVTRDAHGQHHATVHPMANNGNCLDLLGTVVGIRIHELVLFTPGNAGWFARHSTAFTKSQNDSYNASMQPGVEKPMLI